jgi:ubiquinone/menaquinone biosynthesis C-methylase UbiE
MFIRNFIPASVKKWIHKTIYNNVQKCTEKGKLKFLNLGYIDDNDNQFICSDVEFTETQCVQLYYQLLKEVNLENKRVVEIGCGAGGGCEMISQNFKPKSTTGMDLSNRLIDSNIEKYKNQKIEFIQGSADSLPFAENSIDIIINLESSHCYPSRFSFINEVKRTLKPNGLFCYADIMHNKDMAKMEKYITSNFKVLIRRDISRHVILSLDKTSEYKNMAIKKHGNRFIPRTLQNIFYVTSNSGPYKRLKSGKVNYLLFIAMNSSPSHSI